MIYCKNSSSLCSSTQNQWLFHKREQMTIIGFIKGLFSIFTLDLKIKVGHVRSFYFLVKYEKIILNFGTLE
jgi:hypothetical protein